MTFEPKKNKQKKTKKTTKFRKITKKISKYFTKPKSVATLFHEKKTNDF